MILFTTMSQIIRFWDELSTITLPIIHFNMVYYSSEYIHKKGGERMKQWKWLYGLLLASLLFVSLPNLVEDYSGKAYASETVVQESVNLNTASLAQLKLLDGVGDVLAQRIIENRPYEKLDDLLKVKGIGDKTLIKIKEQGLAVVEDPKLVVNPFDDDDQILSGTAMPNATIKVYINSELIANINADSKGSFAYKIGYVDYSVNKIKVEEWRGANLAGETEFFVKSSGNIRYFSGLYDGLFKSTTFDTIDPAGLLDSSDSFQATLNGRYIGLIKQVNLNIKTYNIAYNANYQATPDKDGKLKFSIKPTYYANLANKVAELNCEAVDARVINIESQRVSTGILSADLPVAKDIKVVYQNNQLIYSSDVSPGVEVNMGISGTKVLAGAIPLTSDFPQYKHISLALDYEKDNYVEHLGKYNLPITMILNRKSTNHRIYCTQVQNQDINQPPASITSEHTNSTFYLSSGDVLIAGIPNSLVKIRLQTPDYDWEEYGFLSNHAANYEYTVKLNESGNVNYHDIPSDLAYYLQFYRAAYVSNIVDGVSGKENKLNLDRDYYTDDFTGTPIEKFKVYAKNKELLIN